ncbi:Metal tolerance protein 3 [Tetrabaena socialis]|uniref:Metal tolerance protein 3 n=1 Tax=Tetrabaena socialis TaxID=47790 RepID=A0A2J8AJ00_9CHLO|nr:Metal tolerance protein 3 [Tetrabaena socialis]|eukprot:PNH12488.1 Metal tolerance protein 3 [Tetrabaena socialis]
MSQLAREVVLGGTAAYSSPAQFTASIAQPRAASLERTSRTSVPDVESASVHEEAHEPLLLLGAAPIAGIEEGTRGSEAKSFARRVRIGINASWTVNVLLLISKAGIFVLSGSYAVLASAIDSLVDLLSQAVLAVAESQAARFDERYPIGRTRAAELSVLACACIMFVSTVLVIREAVGALWDGLHGEPPPLQVDATLFAVLGGATALKLGLFIYCRALCKNPIMVALSEDHANDVLSNVAAVVGAAVAGNVARLWYVDPAVAIVFSLLIVRSWLKICWDQGQKMIGLGAPEELVAEVTGVTEGHHLLMQLDRVTAYHHGSHMVVEVEVMLPPGMTVRESHDIALALQHKIEAIESVERAFVHVDYCRRSLEEHKVERNLKLGVLDVMTPLAGLEPTAAAGGSPRAGEAGGGSPPGCSGAAAGLPDQGAALGPQGLGRDKPGRCASAGGAAPAAGAGLASGAAVGPADVGGASGSGGSDLRAARADGGSS